MENYCPTRLLLKEGNSPDFSPVLGLSESTFLVISNSLRQRRPDIISRMPDPLEIFSDVGSNPGLSQLQDVPIPSGTTQVVGIGGGSKMDAAKAIFARVLTKDKYSLKELIQTPSLMDEARSQRYRYNFILVPTTFGSSSELTKWGTIWNWEEKKKHSISHELLYADSALVYPELSLTAPRDVTAYTGLDAFSHALESFWNKDGNFITRNNSLESIRLCVETLPALLKELNSMEYRTQMAKASILAGFAFSQTRTAAAHALSYPLTIHHDIPHGYACSLTLGTIFEYNLSKQPDLNQVLKLFQSKYGSNKSSFSECFQRFLEDCEVPSRLSDFGVVSSDIPLLVQDSFHPDRFNNMAYALSADEVGGIFQSIL
jgi:alcohol dehydrogenase